MKKLFLITAVLIPLLTACPETDKEREHEPIPPVEELRTTIVFDNTHGTCAITVYSSNQRGEANKVVQVPAGSVSDPKDWPPSESMIFFFTYQINFRGIDDFTIDYVPPIGKDQKQVRIDSNVRNTIQLPLLSEALTSLDTFLSNKSHLFIHNNSSYSLQLLRGDYIIPPDNVSETVVNSRERPQYTIDPAPASNYRLLGGSANPVSFPASLVNFEAGRAYYLSFTNDTLSLIPPGILDLIPGNVAGLSLGKARVIYYWVNQGGLETTSTAAIIPAGRTVTITPQGTGYEVKQWYLNGINTGQSGDTYEFSNTTIGEHTVDLIVEKDSKIYNASITITVATPYTVTFDANGGSGTAPAAQDYLLLGSGITLPEGDGLSMSGYIFSGWNTSADGTGTNYDADSAYIVPGDVTLYAKWNVAYTITFDANGGSGTAPDNQVVAVGSSATLPGGSGLTRTNSIFGGWNTNTSGTDTNYGVGSSYTPADNVTLYAMWFPNSSTSLTVGTWSNGSITSTASGSAVWYSFSVVSGNTYSISWNDREHGDYEKTLDVKVSAYNPSGTSLFTQIDDGWTNPQEFTASSDGTVRIKVEPYASNGTGTFAVRYTSNVTITFDANGATDGTAPSAQTVSAGSSITLPAQGSLTRTGYAFGGWNTNSSGTGTNYFAGSSYTVSGNVTLYARWTSTASGSGSEANPIALTAGTWTSGSISSTASGSAMWYSFSATSGTTYYIWWNDSDNSGGTLDVKVAAYYSNGSNIFDVDNSSTNSASFSASSTGTVKIKVYPLSSGRTGTFAVAYSTSSTRPSTTSNVTITFDANGATGGTAPSAQTVSAGSSITLPAQGSLTRTGYTFGGWNTNSSGTGTNYTAGSPYTVSSNVTLYARWIASSTRTVTIDMYDSVGDGWDGGGALRINKNGSQLATNIRVSSGSSNTYTFSVVTGDVIQVYWVAGSYQSENSFVIYYAGSPPSPAFTASTTSWSGTNALVYRVRGSMNDISDGTLLGSFTVP